MSLLDTAISKIGGLDNAAMARARKRLDNLTKPQGSLGRLEELAKQITGITGKENPPLKDKVIVTMAGDHGITEEKVSAYPKEVTPQMVYNFLSGGAAINVLARQAGARVVVVDMGVATKIQAQQFNSSMVQGLRFKDCKIGLGTKNFAKGAAMTKEEAILSIEKGIAVFEEEFRKGLDILGTGDMGIGNTTPSAAIISVISGKPVDKIAGRGTGLNDTGLLHKIAVIKKGIKINKPNPRDAIDVLAKVGGFEIGGLTGVILAGAAHRVPVVIDGFISTAAAMLAVKLAPKSKDFLISSHCSAENGHKCALEYMGMRPLLDLNMRLGEGTGAALAMSLAESAIRIMTEMATFDSAGVAKKNK
ncbi:MAG: nicotinate-nucleotide--dimethylbenzimidazole phosphoribosyltransferase [Planctomycetes bacterium]|nr:nicotinate-nucleotide--dimethylbenzimidazole phosphoribosyltransferase [Planctomycetota bacterium]